MAPLHAPWMAALGWALLHSLWQGLALALLTWLVLRLLQRRDASLRYAVAYGALVITALLAGGTFLLLLPDQAAGPGLNTVNPPPAPGRLEAWVPYASLAWLTGVGITGARLGLGWTWLLRLRTRGAEPAEAPWQARLDGLARTLDLRRGVKLLRSTLVATPMVVGWVKPVVLVPASAFLGLPPAALEAILAHELAHVRRLDYLFNLLQNLLETLLFYHPAAWWLARQIRAERENAADDLAIALVGDPVHYARALADLETLRSLPPTSLQLAPAATGGSLMNRIRRILLPPTPPLPTARAGLLTALAVTALATATAVGFAEEKKPQEIRHMTLREGDKRIDLQLKGDARLDPQSPSGVTLGEDASAELTVREAPVRKQVTLRKNAQGETRVLKENGQEKPLQGADETWLKGVLGELKALEGKVAPGKTETFRMEVEEAGKDGRPRIFTYRLGPGSTFNGSLRMSPDGSWMSFPPSPERFHMERFPDGDLQDHLDALKKHGRQLRIETRRLPGSEEEHRVVLGDDVRVDVEKHLTGIKESARKIAKEIRVEVGKDGKRTVTVDGEPVAAGEGKDGLKIRVAENLLSTDHVMIAPKPHKDIRIETKVGEGKDGPRKIIIREGDKVTERELPRSTTLVLQHEDLVASGDPKQEAAHLRQRIERLQKRLKELEGTAKAEKK